MAADSWGLESSEIDFWRLDFGDSIQNPISRGSILGGSIFRESTVGDPVYADSTLLRLDF